MICILQNLQREDGINPCFYQKYWSLIGDDVIAACLSWLNVDKLPNGLNDTLVVLIPKKKEASKMLELRPISLCNVLYKVVLKTLANILKQILLEVVEEAQSAYVPRRLITDNIIVAYEIMHYMGRKRDGLYGLGALKLDISKAYNKIGWGYLKHVLQALGFNNRWVELVMMCVSNVHFKILFGGQKLCPVTIERGLRQGCPLLPYLFILCAQGLSDLIKKFEARGLIHGVKVSSRALVVSHLFFCR